MERWELPPLFCFSLEEYDMSDTPDMVEDLEFENQIAALGDNPTELMKFVARQQYRSAKSLIKHDKRIKHLETQNKKLFAIVGGVGAVVTLIFNAVVEFFMKKGVQ